MNIVVPMCGSGQRFKEAGYTEPKPFIKLNGEPMIKRMLKSIGDIGSNRLILVARQEFEGRNLESICAAVAKDWKIVYVEGETKGAVDTVYRAKDYVRLEEGILIADCDNFYHQPLLEGQSHYPHNIVFWFEPNKEDGVIYSYSHRISENQTSIMEITEKNNPTKFASQGNYYFASAEEFFSAADEVLSVPSGKEAYISSAIKEMLGVHDFRLAPGPKHTCVGTPRQLQAASSLLKEEPKTFCFDLDETLLTKEPKEEYRDCKPIQKNVEFVKSLKRAGHKIQIYTARGMLSRKGNLTDIEIFVQPIVKESLAKFQIPYDELIFGKPYADYYIDDKAVSANVDLEKELGFYFPHTQPRSFNSLEETSTYIVKRGKIEGERYYYNNIPEGLEDLFPKLLAEDKDSICIERVEGIPASYLNACGQLTYGDLGIIITALNRIHGLNSTSTSMPMLGAGSSYRKKMFERIAPEEDIFLFDSAAETSPLESYHAHLTQIHGDSVFSNIILHNGKVKFIDMRGEFFAQEKTIHGDKFYDYAKVLQSLLGYDEICHGRPHNQPGLPDAITCRRIDWFWDLVDLRLSDREIVKQICKTLIISAIPLQPENADKLIDLLRRMKRMESW